MPPRSQSRSQIYSTDSSNIDEDKIDINSNLRFPEPYWTTRDGRLVRLYLGDVVDVLKTLPSRSIQTVITSPPYWGLRDYGTATWEGGNDQECDHKSVASFGATGFFATNPAKRAQTTDGASGVIGDGSCKKCGAIRIDMQIGSEPSPDCGTQGKAQCGRCFVCTMVAVFRGVRRVLRDDGTLWLNLGDTYGGYGESRNSAVDSDGAYARRRERNSNDGTATSPNVKSGLSSGNLVGIPWRVALALQANRWVLRQDIIWHKPSPMPESVRNRCTKSHEYIFLLTKSMEYFYDCNAIREKGICKEVSVDDYELMKAESSQDRWYQSNDDFQFEDGKKQGNKNHKFTPPGGRNKRSVWSVSSQGYEGAHFATFPKKLITPCILAGTSEYGACTQCGAPWRRSIVRTPLTRERPNDYVKRTGEAGTGNSCSNSVAGVEIETLGWEQGCDCPTEEVRPCIVLDPFMGSGTTAEVCIEKGLHSIGIDLSEKYIVNNTIPRLEGVLQNIPVLATQIVRVKNPTPIGKPISIGKPVPTTKLIREQEDA